MARLALVSALASLLWAPLSFAAELVPVTVKVTDELTGANLSTTLTSETEVGTDGLSAMQRLVETGVRRYPGAGVFVESIAGIRAPDGAFWALSIDGERSTVGIADVTIERAMTIEWRLLRLD